MNVNHANENENGEEKSPTNSWATMLPVACKFPLEVNVYAPEWEECCQTAVAFPLGP